MDSKKGNLFNFLHKAEPADSFWNWNKDNSKRWRINDEKRFAASDLFAANRQKTETFVVLGPGAGAGVGCGVGFGFGLAGGLGYSTGPWNHLRVVLGFGAGCGVGAGFGYGQGFGYGSTWKYIKSDVLGFKERKRDKKTDSHKQALVDW